MQNQRWPDKENISGRCIMVQVNDAGQTNLISVHILSSVALME